MTGKISIVVTTYNRERYIGAAVESILTQTKPELELIVWDDGSTDRSVEVAIASGKGDPRLRVVAAGHTGFAGALKGAIAQTNGDYVGWVDSDDFLAPTALEETAAVLDARPEVGLVYTDYVVTDSRGQVKSLGQRCRIPYSPDRLLVDFMVFHFRLFRRELYDLVGGINPKFNRACDYDLCLRMSEVTQIEHLPKPLYYYRRHGQNMTEQSLEQILESQEVVEEAIARRGLDKDYELEVKIIGQFSLRRKHKP